MTEFNIITGERILKMAAALAVGFSIKSNKSITSGGGSNEGGSSSTGPSSTKPEPVVTPIDPEEK